MADVIINDEHYPVASGEALKASCKKAGIPFGCEDGQCGTCLLEIKKGREHLNELNEAERDLGITDEEEDHLRLGCQCKIAEDAPTKAKVEVKGYI